MNHVILLGRFTKDPELVYSGRGKDKLAISNFTLAVDRPFLSSDNERKTDFIRCMAFGNTAANIEKFFSKGNKICVTGRWQTGSYTDRDGIQRYDNTCVVERFDFCESVQR